MHDSLASHLLHQGHGDILKSHSVWWFYCLIQVYNHRKTQRLKLIHQTKTWFLVCQDKKKSSNTSVWKCDVQSILLRIILDHPSLSKKVTVMQTCFKMNVSFVFTLMTPTVAFLLNPSAFTASYKQLTKNYNIKRYDMLSP